MKNKFIFLFLLVISSCSDSRDAQCIDSWFNCLTGKGVYKFSNGDIYDGDWKNDIRDGQGTQIYVNGDIYTGKWKDDMKNGQGTFTYINGDIYTGFFLDDKKYGRGTFTYSNGDIYTGEFLDDKKYGRGTFTYSNGDIFTGEFLDNKKNGQGIFTFANEKKVMGIWKDHKLYAECSKGNCINGQGSLAYVNGDIHIGTFVDSKKSGVGTFTSKEKKEVGQWIDNKLYNGFIYHNTNWRLDREIRNGDTFRYKVKDKYDNGDYYEGWARNRQRDGQGTYTWSSGSTYTGDWENGKRTGQGTNKYSDGDEYIGEFKNGKRHGQGTYTFANGDSYSGEFRGKYIKTISNPDIEACYQIRYQRVSQYEQIYQAIRSQLSGYPSYLQQYTDQYLSDVGDADDEYEMCKGGFTKLPGY